MRDKRLEVELVELTDLVLVSAWFLCVELLLEDFLWPWIGDLSGLGPRIDIPESECRLAIEEARGGKRSISSSMNGLLVETGDSGATGGIP